MKTFEVRQWLWAVAAFFILALPACSPSEVRGTYDVEIEFAGVPTTLKGTLILSAGFLDIPPLAMDERAELTDWLASDTLDANSCFILRSPSAAGGTSGIVRVFGTQMRGKEIALPIEIYRTPSQRIEIVDLKFFANTTGGEVLLYDRDRQREGRIGGVRTGAPSAEQCQEELETFRAELRASMLN